MTSLHSEILQRNGKQEESSMSKTIANMSGFKNNSPTNIILDAGKSVYIRIGGYDQNNPTVTPDLNETVPEEVSSGTGNLVISARDGEAVIKTTDDGSLHIDVTQGNVVINAKNDHITLAMGNRISTILGNEMKSVVGNETKFTAGNEIKVNLLGVENFLFGGIFDFALAEVIEFHLGGKKTLHSYYEEANATKSTTSVTKIDNSGTKIESHDAAHLHSCEGPTILADGAIILLPA
jgi:hypothetical protein